MGQGMPSPAGSPGTPLTWLQEAELYLTSNGWVRVGINPRGQTLWDDPLGGKGKEYLGEEQRLPSVRKEGGRVTIVQQLQVPLRSWIYPTEEAFGVQRARDKAGVVKANPIPQPVNSGAA